MTENKKHNGAYYTPEILSTFLTKHIFTNYNPANDLTKILEPSCGDGEFVRALIPHLSNQKQYIDLVEINQRELTKCTELLSEYLPIEQINGYNKDFLYFKFNTSYSLIIGNPPYISKEHLNDEQIELCKKICQPYISGEVKNIWPAFLISAIKNLSNDGIMCFVLPSELLQVKYTRGLRKLILDSFERIEVYAFNELIFEKVEQDVVALIGIKKHQNNDEHGVSFYQVDKLEDLTIPNYIEMNFNVHREKLDKWTNYILSDAQLNTIDRISSQLNLLPIKHYCEKAEVGIVTAANSFFIRKMSDLSDHDVEEYIMPILQKSSFIQNSITITRKSFDSLKASDKPVNFIRFSNIPKKNLSRGAKSYISNGECQRLHKRFKMTKRTHWYSVPSVWSSHGIFSKRSHSYPRMFWNQANVLVTDSFYRVVCKNEFNIRNLVFSFYNSLTLVIAELEGRYYGGGVLELIPSEFRSLQIPYSDNITVEQFNELENLFKAKKSLNQILDYTDPILLPNIDPHVIFDLREMRNTLFNRRTKNIDKFVNEVVL